METSEKVSTSRKRLYSHSRSQSKSPSDKEDVKKKKLDENVDEITPQDFTNDDTGERTLQDKCIITEESNESKIEENTITTFSDNENNEPDTPLENDSDKIMITESNATEQSLNSSCEKDDVKKNYSVSDSSNVSSDNKDSLPTLSKTPITPTKKLIHDSPSKNSTPKQLQKKLEYEIKQQERQKEKEERIKKKMEEKVKRKELKDKELEQRQKEKEMKKKEKDKELEARRKEKEEKEEKKRKEREEREQKRKEREEKEEQKRKEREEEKQKKMLEIEEKNKEKLKEEEKKQKVAAAFVNFFVPKKSEETQDEKKTQISNFLQFEIKSDMKLPLPRRDFLTKEQKEQLESFIANQDIKASYLKDLSSGKRIGRSLKTWPYEECIDDDVVVVDLGETICEDKSSLQKYKAKYLYFHENRRPAYYGTWRKVSKLVKPRKPLVEDKELLNYEEDSDDDWEEEEQGESLNGSDDEADKENEDEKDDYEVDNEFFVPHGHLSDDEVDDEEMSRLSPESLKQKLKLLKEEFDQDMQSKTHKLKPRSIGCIWYNKNGSNVEEAVDRYLQPLAIINRSTIIIKNRMDIFMTKEKNNKFHKELAPDLIPVFLKIVHGSSKKKVLLFEQFLTHMEKVDAANIVSKVMLIRLLKKCATWEKYKDKHSNRYKFRWIVNQNLREKYNLEMLDS